MAKPFHINTLTELHSLAGVPAPNHPLVSIFKVEDLPEVPEGFPEAITLGFYSIGLKRNLDSYVSYGRGKYDFDKGVLAFTSPQQVLSYNHSDEQNATGWLLFFHNELLSGHPLEEQIVRYNFFGYEVDEALHLSEAEEEMMEQLFNNIRAESSERLDLLSKRVLLSNIELLLTYSERFYRRQFITRNDADAGIYKRFEKALRTYFASELIYEKGQPGVAYFAEKLNVSSNYLSDLLRALTGKSTHEHIQYQIIEKAKNTLLGTEKSIAEIAYELGFEYPQYFSTLFKKKVGMSPSVFRAKRL